ncbi:MAG: RHS repeat-associated core domain-containing protein [Pyrinomonadaceae bacterium]
MRDAVRKQFTGYERDIEINLDFAEARYYNPAHGRFTGVDPFGPWVMTDKEKAEFLSLPQRWNRYVYVSGNPLKYSDPTGLYVCDSTVSKEQCTQIQKGLEALRDKGTKEQQKFAKWLLHKDNKTVFTIGEQASVGINDSKGANELIQRGNATVNEASKFITITLDKKGDFSTSEGFSGTEPVLAHEGRHAWVAADLITSFSNGSAASDISHYENEFQAHYSAALYLRKQGGEYADWGISKLGHLRTENGKIGVNEKAIRDKLKDSYGLTKERSEDQCHVRPDD